MTDPADATTVATLREHLDRFDDDIPVAVKASGAYDFLDPDGLDEVGLKPDLDVDCDVAIFLDGDLQ
jgi:hypothetical protein